MAMEILEASIRKNHRRYFCTKEKLRAIARVKAGERQRPVAHSMGVGMDTLREWIAQLAPTDWSNGVKMCTPENDLLDRAVYTWYIQQLQAELRPTPGALLKKSSVFANRLYGHSTMVTEEMLERWQSRHCINLEPLAEPPRDVVERELEFEFALQMEAQAAADGKETKESKTPTKRKGSHEKTESSRKSKAKLKETKKKRTKLNGDLTNGTLRTKRRRLDSDNNSEKENSGGVTPVTPAPPSAVVETNEKGPFFLVKSGVDLKDVFHKLFSKQKGDVALNIKSVSGISERIKTLETEMMKLETSLSALKRFPMNFRAALLMADDSLVPSLSPSKKPAKYGPAMKTFSRAGSPPKFGPTVTVKDGMLPSDVEDNSPIEYTNDTRNDVIHVGQNKLERQHLPPFGPVVRQDLQIGMQVFAAKTNTLGIWVRARVQEVKIVNSSGLLGIVYRIRYENRKHGFTRLCPPKLLAYVDPPNVTLPVGSRVIARYKEDTGEYHHALYAGIIAEPPKSTNNYRYLIFFDDGYAQYVRHFEVHLVCSGKKEVWEEIHEDSRQFIKKYLKQYPERPMVKLLRGQTVLTEWNGSWWNARVMRVDGSLVEMYFDSDRRTEWIYRGSTRLAPLFNELNRTMAIELSGRPVKRHNTMIKKKDRPYVEYTRNESDEEARMDSPDSVTALDDSVPATDESEPKQTSNTARKHTIEYKQTARKSTTQELTVSTKRVTNFKATIDPAKAVSQMGQTEVCEVNDSKRIVFAPHRCSTLCISLEDPTKHKGQNPLRIPLLCGWQREITKQKPGGKRCIFYRAPCGRRFRFINEIAHFLGTTKSKLSVDLFCFDVYVHTFSQFRPLKICFYIKDMTYGKEPVPVCCVNSLGKDHPPFVEYSSRRFPATGVELNTDPEFLCGCDCEDNCQNREKCQCQQLSVTASAAVPGGPIPDVGYKYRRLNEPILTGIYECNSRCKCKASCFNRVAQNGLLARLQVFKTEQRGWGIRSLDDIPQGMFICNYAGQLLNEQLANEDGNQYGDEYQAELDHIEVVERMKEGYESDVVEEGDDVKGKAKLESKTENKESEDEDKEWKNRDSSDSDSDFKAEAEMVARTSVRRCLRKRFSIEDTSSNDSAKSKTKTKSVSSSNSSSVDSKDETSVITDKVQTIMLDEDECKDSNKDDDDDKKGSIEDEDDKSRCTVKDLDSDSHSSRRSSLKSDNDKSEMDDKKDVKKLSQEVKKESKFVSVRSYFNEEYCYIMDAKICGNIGRYLNHSCCPNVFVQNVFVDSHDLRFPWVAFFAATYIRAGTELTWDYNYDVGSVPGKVMYCHCGTAECRGRLL